MSIARMKERERMKERSREEKREREREENTSHRADIRGCLFVSAIAVK